MNLKKKYILFFLSLLLISIPPIFLGITIYKPILNVSPQFAELEIQDYYLVFTIIFSLFSLFFVYSFKNPILNLLNRFESKIRISILFLLIISLLEVVYIANFYKNSYPALLRTSYFMEVGIITENSFALSILVCIIVSITIALFVIIKKTRIRFHKIFYLLSIVFICLLTFKIANLNNHDFAYFAGPINDVLHGKHLLYNSPSQYGFLSIVFLSIIFKFIPLGLMNLTIVNAVIVTLGFILVFILLQFLYKNKLLSLFAIIFIIFLNYIIQIIPDISILQTSFIRFGMWVVLALSLCFKEFYTGSKYKRLINILPYLVLSISFFWVLDNGIYILLAFISYKFFNNLKPNFWLTLKTEFYEILKIIISIGLGLFFITLIYNFLFGIFPHWDYYMSDPSLYLGGFGLMPLPAFISWYGFILVGYLIMLSYIFAVKRFSKNFQLNKEDRIFSFVLLYGIFQFSYFMGRSHSNNLHHVIIPFLICLFYLIEIFIKSIKKNERNIYYLAFSLLFSLLISLPLYFVFIQGSKNLISYNFFTTLDVLKNKKNIETNYLNNTVQSTSINLLNIKYGDYIKKNGIVLISINDTWYLVNLNTINNIESNNLRYYVRVEPLKKIATDIIKNNYKFVFVDSYKLENFGQVQTIYNDIKMHYKEKEQIGSLIVLERLRD